MCHTAVFNIKLRGVDMSLADQMKQLSNDSLVKRAAELKGTDEYAVYTTNIKRVASYGLKQITFDIHVMAKRIALMEALTTDGFVVTQGKKPVNITVHW